MSHVEDSRDETTVGPTGTYHHGSKVSPTSVLYSLHRTPATGRIQPEAWAHEGQRPGHQKECMSVRKIVRVRLSRTPFYPSQNSIYALVLAPRAGPGRVRTSGISAVWRITANQILVTHARWMLRNSLARQDTVSWPFTFR